MTSPFGPFRAIALTTGQTAARLTRMDTLLSRAHACVMALAAILALVGCSSLTEDERDYLDNIAVYGWTVDSDRERERALDFGYDVCDLLREGRHVSDIRVREPGGPGSNLTKKMAVEFASQYLC